MKDVSNFYNLTIEEQTKGKKNLWKDSFPEIPEFAKGLQNTITKKECPKVIALEGGYGMGKTYFSSRFCEYLRNGDNPISSVYFSAWEDDNLPDPFLSFSKAITRNLQTTRANIDEFLGIFIKVMSSFDISFGVPCFSATFKFKDLKKELLKQKNPLANFRLELQNIVKKLPGERLVLIVDELDRCRPDYAIKVLETIKHFFDVEGVIIILPVNYNTLVSCVEAVYSLDDRKAEEYLRKFINYKITIPSPNYRQFIENAINKDTLKKEKKAGYLDVENKPFCKLEILQEDLIRYSEAIKPSLRELTNLLNIVELAIREKKERICCSLLVHVLFKKFIKDNRPDIKSEDLPINEDLKTLLVDRFKTVMNLYTKYLNDIPRVFRENRGLFSRSITEQKCDDFINDFKKVKTYSDILNILNGNTLLDEIYGCSVSGYSEVSKIRAEICQLINLGINNFGIFEIDDELNTRPKVQEYKDFVNYLQI